MDITEMRQNLQSAQQVLSNAAIAEELAKRRKTAAREKLVELGFDMDGDLDEQLLTLENDADHAYQQAHILLQELSDALG